MSTNIKQWAVLDKDGIVTNVILWDGETDWQSDDQTIDLTDWPSVGIGCKWDGTTFEDVRPPAEPFTPGGA